MKQVELCFIEYLSCFLNFRSPTASCDNWEELYDLANLNEVTGIIAHTLKKLPKNMQPLGTVKSNFSQKIGLTVINYEKKLKSQSELIDFLNENYIEYSLVKGAAISQYYPAPELRTSSDIDIVVRSSKFNDIIKKFNKSKFKIKQVNTNVVVININETFVEIHRDADVLGNYFTDSFFDKCDKKDNQYILNQYDQLLYVILHLAKHLKYRGAGIRMLMDMDVCIRAIENFDEEKLLNMCSDAGIEKCAKTLLSLINYWFNTPVHDYIQIKSKPKLVELLSKSFLHGGIFGFNNNNLGNHYVAQATTRNRVDLNSKMKSFIKFLLPPKSTIKATYIYVHKYPFLLPIGYLNRFTDGLFKRGKHSFQTIKQIISSNDSVLIENQILNELDLI